MIIYKDVNRKVAQEYFFIKGKVDIDAQYYIDKIKQSCESNDNLNNITNIKGSMTPWNFFCEDKKLLKILVSFCDLLDERYSMPPYTLQSSWGFELKPGQHTNFHSHTEAMWSGVIYLNKCDQPLEFPEIKEKIDPEEGSFGINTGFLTHGCKKNRDTISKFGIAFNMVESKSF